MQLFPDTIITWNIIWDILSESLEKKNFHVLYVCTNNIIMKYITNLIVIHVHCSQHSRLFPR